MKVGLLQKGGRVFDIQIEWCLELVEDDVGGFV